MRYSLILSGNTPPMIRKCIPLYKPVINGNITFRERRVLEMSTSSALDHHMLVFVPSPTQNFPYHHAWSLGWGPMQYGIIPTWTIGRSWQVPRSYEAQLVWSRMDSHGWLGSYMDQHVPHAHQQCVPSIGPCSCQTSIFPSWHIACAAIECSKPVEYATCAPPKFFWRWGCHPNIPPQKSWWRVSIHHPSTSWKWLVHLLSQRAWPTIRGYLL